MIEFAVLLHLKRRSETIVSQFAYKSSMKRRPPALKTILNSDGDAENVMDDLLNTATPSLENDESIKKERKLFLRKTKRIDYMTLFVSSMTFTLFNCIYWIYYLLL